MVVSDFDLTLWFLDRGADPNASCDLDMTPLSVAVEIAPMNVIELLFRRGGSVSSGQLLHHAVWRDAPDHEGVFQMILDMHPPINNIMYQDLHCYYLQRAFGLGTPLHGAVTNGDVRIAKLLLDHGANPLIRDSRGETVLDRTARLQPEVRQAMIELLGPYEATAIAPLVQSTDGRQATGWG